MHQDKVDLDLATEEMTTTVPLMGEHKSELPKRENEERRPFQAAAVNVLLAWAVGCVVVVVMGFLQPSMLDDLQGTDVVWIAIGSLVVAIGSGLPGIWLDAQRPARMQDVSSAQRASEQGASDLGERHESGEIGSEVLESGELHPGETELGEMSKAEAARARRKKLVEDIKSLGIGLEFAGSMALRLVGTVALFMLCRYHLAASDKLIAAWVLGWYGWLTFVEVVSLCWEVSPARSWVR